MKEARYFKALGDPIRLQLLEHISKGQNCICHLQDQFSVSQPTLSHHMKILVDAGVVDSKKIGKNVYYTINQTEVAEIITYLRQLQTLQTVITDYTLCPSVNSFEK
ncbi:MAG: ArsR/SmtB family transcription factor [Culicoidibacterales bacterium]